MRDPELPERIRRRISESSRNYSRSEQMAELLLRNKKFLRERMEFPFPEFRIGHEDPSVRRLYRQKIRQQLDPKQDLIRRIRKEPRYTDIRKAWSYFCYRWRINWWWDGREESLSSHVNTNLEVFYREAQTDKVEMLRQVTQLPEPFYPRINIWDVNVAKEPAFIYIKLNPWTEIEDLRSFRPDVERIKKEVFGYSERGPSTFARNLCWYDLHEKEEYGKKSYENIRGRWNSSPAAHENSVASRVIIQKAVERIKMCIERLTPIRRYSVPLVSPRKRTCIT
jgi:hypothetical protein